MFLDQINLLVVRYSLSYDVKRWYLVVHALGPFVLTVPPGESVHLVACPGQSGFFSTGDDHAPRSARAGVCDSASRDQPAYRAGRLPGLVGSIGMPTRPQANGVKTCQVAGDLSAGTLTCQWGVNQHR
jgi:hypothetical protein